MTSQLQKDDFLMQIRSKLRTDGVKLWLSPFYNESSCTSSIEDIKLLAENYSVVLHIPFDMCQNILIELQVNSIENLKQKNQFQKSGVATIKIKILHPNSPARIIVKEIMLSMRTVDLKEILTKEIHTSLDRIKLISSGKILVDMDSLSSQDVKNGQQILALILVESPTETIENENQIRELEEVKTDSRLLALDQEYMQLEDQFGNPIKVPSKEKKALVVAMALHEKGKAALKKEDYSKALVYFLEADIEFKTCNSQLLNTVDNYALLDLDIAWCYLCLQSFAHLPEAFVRLKRCEEKFHSTYGNNLERLIAIKGTTGNEAALFMRLHLLQAIVLYHQNKRSEALALFKQAEREMLTLKVDENSILALVELGFSTAEARLGLRTTKGDINEAANYINENREKRRQSREKAVAQRILEKERKKLGKCADGKQYVDPNFLKILVNMGYNKELARLALQKSNNIISDSIQYIEENPIAGPSGTKSTELLSLIDDLVPQLVEAGFDYRMAKLALEKHYGDIMKAAEELIANNGIVPGDLTKLNIGSKSMEAIIEQQAKKKKAFDRLKEDIEMVDDDHLDLTLDTEETFLKQYLDLLEKDT